MLGVGAVEAFARPFTVAADAATAVALAGVVVLGFAHRMRAGRLAAGDGAASTAELRGRSSTGLSRLVWALLALGVVGFELAQLFMSPRSAHPTLSALLDPIGHSTAGRAIMFAVWLAAGIWLFGPWGERAR